MFVTVVHEPFLIFFSRMLDSLCKKVPFREAQLDLLLNLIGTNTDDDPWPCIYIYGHTATGKSLAVRSVLEALKVYLYQIVTQQFYIQG